MTKSEMTEILKRDLKGLASQFDDDDFSDALDDAARDTGWAFPVSGDFKIVWQRQRAKRHLYDRMLAESAHKFKHKQESLNQRFDHYSRLVYSMDKRFDEIQKQAPEEFANVDAYQLFGTKIDAGFQYEPLTGRDTTYDDENEVIVHPNENS